MLLVHVRKPTLGSFWQYSVWKRHFCPLVKFLQGFATVSGIKMELLEDTYEVACDQARGVTNHLPLCDSPEDHQKANSVWVTGFFSSLTSSDLCQASLDLAPVHPSSAEPLLQNTHCRTTALLICSDLNLMSPRFD